MQASALAGVSVVGSLARSHTVKPGQAFEGIILLRNAGDEPTEVRVSQTDYLFFADGRNLYDEPGTVPRSNARWITISPSRLTVPPKQTASVYFKGTVPDKAELKGSYWSMVMVEPVVTPSPAVKGETNKVTVGLQTLIRYAVQIVTEIGDTGTRDIKFLDKKVVVAEGKRTLRLDIENTGERMLSPTVWAELHNEQGVSIGKFEGSRQRIYPGCSVRQQIDLTAVPPGKFTALVVVDNGDDQVMGAQYQLEIEK